MAEFEGTVGGQKVLVLLTQQNSIIVQLTNAGLLRLIRAIELVI